MYICIHMYTGGTLFRVTHIYMHAHIHVDNIAIHVHVYNAHPRWGRKLRRIARTSLLHADDSWLEISPGELEELLHKAAGVPSRKQVPTRWLCFGGSQCLLAVRGGECNVLFSQPSAGLGLEAMVAGMKSFVDKVSSHQGAEFPE